MIPTLKEPWISVPHDLAARLEAELKRELGHHHVLQEKKVEAVARRQDCDDVLFSIAGSSTSYAVVHLTWSGKKEIDPKWPSTELFATIEDWEKQCMIPDHEEFTL